MFGNNRPPPPKKLIIPGHCLVEQDSFRFTAGVPCKQPVEGSASDLGEDDRGVTRHGKVLVAAVLRQATVRLQLTLEKQNKNCLEN